MKKNLEYLSTVITKEEHMPPEKVIFHEKKIYDKIEPIYATYIRPKIKINWEGKKTAVKLMRLNELNLLNIDNNRKDKLLVSNNENDENNNLKIRVIDVIPLRLSLIVMRTDTPLAFIKWFFLNNYTSISKRLERFYYYKIVLNNRFLRKLHKINLD